MKKSKKYQNPSNVSLNSKYNIVKDYDKKERKKMYGGLISPTVDYAFKKIFGTTEREEVLIHFLNSVIEPKNEISKVYIQNPEKLRKYPGDKSNVLDIEAKTDSGEIINIEVQVGGQPDFKKRTLYYWSKLYTGQLKSGHEYEELKKVICINVLNFNCIEGDEYHSVSKVINLQTNQIMNDDLEIHFIELPKFKGVGNLDEASQLDLWVEFLKNPSSEAILQSKKINKVFDMALDELLRMSQSEDDRRICDAREKASRDERARYKYQVMQSKEEGIKQGKEEGIRQGKEEGIRQGKEEGIRQGKEEGIRQGRKEVVKNLIVGLIFKGFSKNDIVEMIGITIEEYDECMSAD